MGNAVSIIKLSKYYGKARGVIDLSLNVEEGDFFGFIGQNGAGKSTTIRSLLGLIKPSGGRAEIFGHDIVKEKKEVLRQIGYMPSEAVFYQGMQVREVIAYSAGLHKMDCKKEAERLCQRFALDGSKKVEELSLGNRKKVSIVCAMQHKPRLYLLDEPTSGLDPLMQQEFFQLLKDRNQEGATIFLSSHVLSEIGKHCRHAAIVREGRLITCDTVENLTKSNAKRVTLLGKGLGAIQNIQGVIDFKENGEGCTFLYTGQAKGLLTSFIGLQIEDLTVTEPDMEEIFMHFYGGRKNEYSVE